MFAIWNLVFGQFFVYLFTPQKPDPRQIPREIEAGVPENRSQKKQSAPQKPTDPWVFGYGKPPWETAAETLWETEVWCLLCARMC